METIGDASNNFILNGILSMEALKGNPTFSWNNETFACVPNTLNEQINTVNVGFDEDTDFRMLVRLNQFTPNIYPALNDFITYQNVTLQVKQIKKPNNMAWVYVCQIPKVGYKK